MVVVFDVVGTLFILDHLRDVLRDHEVPEEVLELWFARLLHAAFAATLAGRYRPYDEVGESTLRQVLALRGLSEAVVEPALAAVGELDARQGAEACLRRLGERGHRLVALTNSGRDTLRSLLERSGLAPRFAAAHTADEVEACKPHPAPYRAAIAPLGVRPREACLVAAHGWDVVGADAAGLRTVYLDALERRWPFPDEPPGAVVSELSEVPEAVEALSAASPSG